MQLGSKTVLQLKEEFHEIDGLVWALQQVSAALSAQENTSLNSASF